MIGMEPLADLRRSGLRVESWAWVTDTDSPMEHWFSRNWHGNPTGLGMTPYIAICADDMIERLDFRPLVGMEVHLIALRGEDRAKRLFSAIRNAKVRSLARSRDGEIWLYKESDGGNGKRIRS